MDNVLANCFRGRLRGSPWPYHRFVYEVSIKNKIGLGLGFLFKFAHKPTSLIDIILQ